MRLISHEATTLDRNVILSNGLHDISAPTKHFRNASRPITTTHEHKKG